ncbi:MAG: FG-GAP repeat domain-containing protein [Spirochaetota bacterium]
MSIYVRLKGRVVLSVLVNVLVIACSPDNSRSNGGFATAWQCNATGCSSSTGSGGGETTGGGTTGGSTTGGNTTGGNTTGVQPPAPNAAFPTAISYGQSMSAHLLATEFQSAAITYSLKSGPAGFSVSNAGLVSWNAQDFMFDSAVDFFWRIEVVYTGVTFSYTGTITVTDSTRNYPLATGGLMVPAAMKSVIVDDFNKDGKNEIIVTNNSDTVQMLQHVPATGRYRVVWQYPYGLSVITGLVAHDLDADTYKEIIVSTDKGFTVIDGKTLRKKRDYVTAGNDFNCELADLSGNTSTQLVCLRAINSTSQVTVYQLPAFSVLWQSSTLDHGRVLRVGNVDSDAQQEIVTSAGYVYDGANFTNQWTYASGFDTDFVLANVTGDSRKEIVTIQRWGGRKVYDADARALLYSSGDTIYKDTIATFNADGDSYDEILIGQNQWEKIYLIDDVAAGSGTIWSRSTNTHGTSFLYVGDTDNDGQLDLLVGSNLSSTAADRLIIMDPLNSGNIKFISNAAESLDGPFYAAGLANTAQGRRLVFLSPRTDSGYEGSRLISWDTTANETTISAQVDTNWSSLGASIVFDYDGDGQDEVAYASAALYTPYFALRRLNSFSIAWNSPNNIGAGSVVDYRDFNGDGYQDIIAGTSEGRVLIFDVRNSAILWTSNILTTGYGVVDLAITDLDSNGLPDILIALGTQTSVYEQAGTQFTHKKTISRVSSQHLMQQIALGSLQDGRKVILIGPQNSQWSTNMVAVYDYNLDLPLYTHPFTDRLIQQIAPDDTVAASGRFLALYRESNSNGLRIGSIDIASGRDVWRSDRFAGSGTNSRKLRTVDFGNVGEKSIAFGTARAMIVSR